MKGIPSNAPFSVEGSPPSLRPHAQSPTGPCYAAQCDAAATYGTANNIQTRSVTADRRGSPATTELKLTVGRSSYPISLRAQSALVASLVFLVISRNIAASTELKIASNYLHADGCHETTETFTAAIPNADKLDTSFNGVLLGIRVVETTGNGERSYRNFEFINGGTAVQYQLRAKGAGSWVDPPTIPLIGRVGGGLCAGAAGGWIGIDIYAVYK